MIIVTNIMKKHLTYLIVLLSTLSTSICAQENDDLRVDIISPSDKGFYYAVLKNDGIVIDTIRGYAFKVDILDQYIIGDEEVSFLTASNFGEIISYTRMKKNKVGDWTDEMNYPWAINPRNRIKYKILGRDQVEGIDSNGKHSFVDLEKMKKAQAVFRSGKVE